MAMAMFLWEPRPRGDALVARRGRLIGARRPSHKEPAEGEVRGDGHGGDFVGAPPSGRC